MGDLVLDASTRTSDYFSGTSETSSEAGPDITTRLADIPTAFPISFLSKVISKAIQKRKSFSSTKKPYDTVYQCQFCPYATSVSSHYRSHTEYHYLGDEKNKDETHSSTSKTGNMGVTVQCPFCSFRARKATGIQRHVRVHFDFNDFLRMRGLEVKYERCWSETDSIRMRSSNEEEEMVVDRDDKTDNLNVFYKKTDKGRRKGSEKVKTKTKK